MDDIEALLESLYTFYAKLAALRAIDGPELLLLGKTRAYKETLTERKNRYNVV